MQFDHFALRLAEPNDGRSFYNLINRNRPRLEDFFSGTVARTRTLEDTLAYTEEIMQRIEARTYWPFFLINQHTLDFAGLIDVKNIDWNIPKAELGCFIDAPFEGKGIATKAFSIIIRHLFIEHGFEKLFLRTSPHNLPACALADHAGFKQEGLLRRDYKTTKGELVDLKYYGLLREEFVLS